MSDTDHTHDATAAEDTRPNEGETGVQNAAAAETADRPQPDDGTAATVEREPLKGYITTEALRHNDVHYPPGSPIDLNDERAEALLKAGIVKRQEPN